MYVSHRSLSVQHTETKILHTRRTLFFEFNILCFVRVAYLVKCPDVRVTLSAITAGPYSSVDRRPGIRST